MQKMVITMANRAENFGEVSNSWAHVRVEVAMSQRDTSVSNQIVSSDLAGTSPSRRMMMDGDAIAASAK